MAGRQGIVSEVTSPGKRYLVGGAVRDELLGVPVKERDWVVVGADADAMLEAGFRRVGKAYPVFLHPTTYEEHALARTETKIGPGHGGFSFDAGATISLEQDLMRRDLTINALAKSETGEIIDPIGGKNDLESHVLRHVSNAFAEDPLRCFRVARFAAMFPEFTVHETTNALMRSMAAELTELSAERVWNEWVKALEARQPHRFYDVVREAEIATPWFQEIDLGAVSAHYENRTITLTGSFALIGWLHNDDVCQRFFERLRSPTKALDMALATNRYGFEIKTLPNLSDEKALKLLEQNGAFHRDARFDNLISALSEITEVDVTRIETIRKELSDIRVPQEPGPDYGRALHAKRLERLKALRT